MPNPHKHLVVRALDFWLARGAVLVIVGLQIGIVNDLTIGPRWLAPVLELAEIVVGAVPGSTIEHVPGSPPEAHVSGRIDFSKLNRKLTAFRPRWNAAFGAKDLYAVLQEVGVTHEDLQTRYNRPAQLRHLVHSGRVDETLRWREGAASVHPEPSTPAFPRER